MLVIELSVQLILIICIGMLLYRLRIIKEGFDKPLSTLVMTAAVPCLIIKSMRVPFSIGELKNCVGVLALSLLVLALSFAVGQIIYCLSGKQSIARALRFSTVFPNFTFFGIPLVEALYGERVLFYFIVFLIPVRILYHSTAKALLSPPGTERTRVFHGITLKGMFSPSVIAVLLGLMLYITQLQLPAPITKAIDSLAACATPLGLIICGSALAKFEIRKLFKLTYFGLSLLRNICLPCLFLGIVVLLKLDTEMARMVVMFTALPISSLQAAFTVRYDPDAESQFGSAAVIMFSTFFSVVTIPLWSNVISYVFPA